MALTKYQREVCRLLAENRVRSGESYVAGGSALNEALRAPRLSRDLDLFHDTEDALAASWAADRASLEAAGYDLRILRDRPGFVEAQVCRGEDSVLIQWSRDSAYRFFPLLSHAELGLTMHPFDLATSKVLALVGRVEPRDFVDTLTCHRELQPLGYLAWAACGKDPGFSPTAILEHAARTTRYAELELAGLDFEGPPPSASELSGTWHAALADARAIVGLLPAEHAGRAVLEKSGALFRGDSTALRSALASDDLVHHPGSIRGAFPRMRS
jgi:hypothetical protein